MNLKEELSKQLNLSKHIISSIQIVGEIALLRFSYPISDTTKVKIAKALKTLLPKIKTVCEIKKIEGVLREPVINVLLGNETETVHKEYGILYALDVRKVMFSKGNVHERHRIARIVRKDETVVDMFAGIGYFSLPIAKKVKKVYAIEKNPTAFKYLLKNLKLNNITNLVAILGDCRNVSLESVADRVIMGYLFNIENFIPHALKYLKEKGVLHVHTINEFDNSVIIKNGYKIVKMTVHKVKSYAPKKLHVVFDVVVKRCN